MFDSHVRRFHFLHLPASLPRSLAFMSTAARGRDSGKKESKKKRTKASLFGEQDHFCVTANHTVTHFLVPLLECCPFVGFSDLWEASCAVVLVCVRVCERESSRGWERAAQSQFICDNSAPRRPPQWSGLLYYLVSGVTLVKHFVPRRFHNREREASLPFHKKETQHCHYH